MLKKKKKKKTDFVKFLLRAMELKKSANRIGWMRVEKREGFTKKRPTKSPFWKYIAIKL